MQRTDHPATRNNRLVSLVLALAASILLCAATAQAATFTVTTTADNGNNNSPTPGSLRKAILDANNNPGPDTIAFNISGSGVRTIKPPAPLPEITGPVRIDGYTQVPCSSNPSPCSRPNALTASEDALLLIEIDGTNAGASASGLTITGGSSTVKGLVISHFSAAAIYITNNGNNAIQGNYLGVGANGTTKAANGVGLIIDGSANNSIGGTSPALRNLISGNTNGGLRIIKPGANNNLVQGNFIGTDASGKTALRNGADGITLDNPTGGPNPSNNVIGGATSGAGNVISGNNGDGIVIGNASGTSVQGNFIGTDATGKTAVGNGDGITVIGGPQTTIGGSTASARNVISGNLFDGIFDDSDTGTVIQGNFIGVDITGNAPLGNKGNGITENRSNAVIGGVAVGQTNVISANGGNGIEFVPDYNNSPVTNNQVLRNIIGYGNDGKTALGNAGHGILITNGSNNTIGYPTVPGNLIGNNDGDGVAVVAGTNNRISSNLITANKGFGIDLKADGITPNDAGDGDTGPNNLQNYPKIVSATLSNGATTIQGMLDSTPNTQFHIEFFANTQPGLAGFGQGEIFVGSTDVLTSAGGTANFNTMFSTLLAGQYITATATAPTGNTSEFSFAVKVTIPLPALSISDLSISEGNNGAKNADLTVTLSPGSSSTVTVNYATTDGTATAGSDYVAKSGTLTFAPGEVTKTISIALNGDTLFEPDKTFFVNLSNPANATIAKGQSTVTILNDDAKPAGTLQFSASSYSVNESSGTATITVQRTGGSNGAVSVQYATAPGGTATAGSDYTAASGTLNWADGDTADKTFNVPITDDPVNEPDETVNLVLSNPTSGATLGSPNTALLTIKDNDPQQPMIQFEQSSYSVNEADPAGVVTVTVKRSGDTSKAVSADYMTSDAAGLTPCQTNVSGLASERCDYATAAGTLRFAAGETVKTIQIPIINDAYVEPDETFNVMLSNPQNISLGNTSTTTVTIKSDDTQMATQNPIDDQAFFIRQQYIDFLGRVAEPAGFQFWMDRMTNCPVGQVCDRTDTSQRFFQSDEFQERGFYVYRLYDAALGRLPLYAEFMPDVARLNGPQTVAEQRQAKDAYLLNLINKQEFRKIYGAFLSPDGSTAVDATGFINALCQTSGITPASKQTLIDNLQSQIKDPAHTLEDFILDPELSNTGTKFYDRGFITMQYFGYLRRDPEPSGFAFWQQKMLDTNHDYRFMVSGFINSDEYRFRFALISAP